MKTTRRCKVLVTGALALAMFAGGAWTAAAQGGAAEPSGPQWAENRQGPQAEGDQTRTQEQIRERIQERIRTAADLAPGEQTRMQENLQACLRAGAADPALEAIFPGEGKGRKLSTQTMLRLQSRVRAAAEEGLPVAPVLAKVQEARTKGVPDPALEQVCERMENHVREAKRVLTQARADGLQPAPDARRERQQIQEMAQQMWRGTSPEEIEQLRTRARERLRTRECTTEDLVAASETATRLREQGVEARRALRVTGQALAQGYGAEEMRRLQFMMVYRHREGRAVEGLVDDLEHCLGASMDAAHMYQYMMQQGWMGPGDMHGPGGSRPIDDQGHGPGHQGGDKGGGTGGGTGPGTGGGK